MEEKVNVRVVLEGDLAKKFLTIKKYYGLKNNTEVFRKILATTKEGSS